MTVEHARDYGHTHLSEVCYLLQLIAYNFMQINLSGFIYHCVYIYLIIPSHRHLQIINYADRLQNKAVLLIHFSARYTVEVWHNCFCLLKMISHPSQKLGCSKCLGALKIGVVFAKNPMSRLDFSKMDVKQNLRMWTVWFSSNYSILVTLNQNPFHISSK